MPGSGSDPALRPALRTQDMLLYHVKTKFQSWSFNSYGALVNVEPSWELPAGWGARADPRRLLVVTRKLL